MDTWESIASSCQRQVLDAIPTKWRLSTPLDPAVTDVREVPKSCGLLTAEQLSITEQTATELIFQLHKGTLTSVQVTEAFCARAAVAHQCVKHLAPFAYFGG